MQISENQFFEIQSKFENIQFSQARPWKNYWESRKYEISYFTDNTDNPNICGWGLNYKLPFFGKILRIEGETFKDECDVEIFKNFYKSITAENYAAIFIISNSIYNIDHEVGIRMSGFIRPLGLESCPLSILIDLKTDLSYSRAFKRKVKLAKKNELSYKCYSKPTIEHVKLFKDLIIETTSRKKISITFDVLSIHKLFDSGSYLLFLAFDNTGVHCSGRILYIHNSKSYDLYAANGFTSLKNGASFFLVDCILSYLKKKNFTEFDFGRIPPNGKSNGIYNFKMSVKGNKILYNGDWNFFKNRWFELLISFYQFFVKKRTRY